MRIAIIPNLTRKHAYEVTKNVCDFLSENGVEYFFEDNLKGQIGFDCQFMSSDELLRTCDIVIAVGGDGSIIHAAKKACKYKVFSHLYFLTVIKYCYFCCKIRMYFSGLWITLWITCG